MKILEKLCKALDAVASFVTICFALAIVFMIFINVVMRFVFKSPISWQYEATLVCTAWMVFIGMSMTTAHSEHMRLTFILTKLSPRVRVLWENAIDAILIVFMLIGCGKAFEIALSTMDQYYQTLPMIRKGIFYVPFCIGAVFSAVHLMFHILKRRQSDFISEAREEEEV